MALNENLTGKVRKVLAGVTNVAEKKMFSGIAFMVNGKLCIAVRNNDIMIRIDPALHDELLGKAGCKPMIMRGKNLEGYVVVNESVLHAKKEMNYWIKLAISYNPKAKASKKKK